ncbi:MAG: immunoglobulin-like domain-containing protein [Patescibacteria group bacterium]
METQVDRKIQLAENLARERELEYRKANSPTAQVSKVTDGLENRMRLTASSMLGAFTAVRMPRPVPLLGGQAFAAGLTAVILGTSVLLAGSGVVARAGEMILASAFEARALAINSMLSSNSFAFTNTAELSRIAKDEIEKLDTTLTDAVDTRVELLPVTLREVIEKTHEPVEMTELAYARAEEISETYPRSLTFVQVAMAVTDAATHPQEVLATIARETMLAYSRGGAYVLNDIETVLALHVGGIEIASNGLLSVSATARDFARHAPLALGNVFVQASVAALSSYEHGLYAYVENVEVVPSVIAGTIYELGNDISRSVATGVQFAPAAYEEGIVAFVEESASAGSLVSESSLAFGKEANKTVSGLLESEDRALALSVETAKLAFTSVEDGAMRTAAAVQSLPSGTADTVLGLAGGIALRIETADTSMLSASPLASLDIDRFIPSFLRNVTAILARAAGSAFHGIFGPLAGFFGASEEVGLAIIPNDESSFPGPEGAGTEETVKGNTTVYNGPVTIVRNEYPTVNYGGVSQTYVDDRINLLRRTLYNRIEDVSDQTTFRGDIHDSSITDSSITNSTFSNGAITDSSFTGGSITGTTLDVASTTVTGSLTVTGEVTTNGVVSVNSTSTNATSTNLFATNLNAGNATTTNFYSALATIVDGFFTNLTATLANITTAVIANLTATNATLTNATSTNATSTNLFAANLNATNATSTNLFVSSARITTGIIDALTSPLANLTTAVIANLSATDATLTNATSTNAFALTYVTPSRLLSVGSNGVATSTSLSSWVTGTLNQLTVTDNGIGGVTLSLPSTIAIGSTQPTTIRSDGATSTFGGGIQASIVEGGQYIAGPYVLATSTTATSAFSGNIAVGRNATFGTSASDLLTVNSSISSNLIPSANNTYDLGSVGNNWNRVYVDEIVANNISAASTSISGTVSESFSINSDNASADTEDSSLVFNRGSASPHALLTWNATSDQFEFNMPVFSATGLFTSATTTNFGTTNFTLNSNTFTSLLGTGLSNVGGALTVSYADLATDFFRQAGNSFGTTATLGTNDAQSLAFETSGTTKMTILSGGNVGIGAASPGAKLDVLSGASGAWAIRALASDSGTLGGIFEGATSAADFYLYAADGITASVRLNAVTGGNGYFSTGGNFGIGTTSPAALLSIAGNGYFTGNVGVGISNPLPNSFFSGGKTLQIHDTGNLANIRLTTANGNDFTIGADANSTYFYTAGAKTFRFYTNATERMQISPTGTVGIGTTTPGALFSVAGSSLISGTGTFGEIIDLGLSANTLTYANASKQLASVILGNGLTLTSGTLDISTSSLASGFFLQGGNSFGTTATLGTNDAESLAFETNGTTQMTILSGGNIGIGTTTPGATLDIQSTYSTTGYPLRVQSSGYYSAYFQGTDANDQASFYMENNRGSFASYGGFLYGGSTSSLGNIFGTSRADRLLMFADGASNLGMYVGTLQAQPFVVGTNNTERMRVDGSGNVGVGTTTPIARLSVLGAGGASSPAASFTSDITHAPFVLQTYAGGYSQLQANTYYNGSGYVRMTTGYVTALRLMDNLGGITFGTGATGAAGTTLSSLTDRMTLTNAGNLGIGSSTPYARLSVKGAGTTTGVNFQTTNSSDSPLLTVLDSGKVGVGTDSPSWRFVASESSDITVAQIGAGSPLYFLRSYPAIGFNNYYSGSWKYGANSGTSFAANLTFNNAAGTLTFSNTAAAGAADATATMATRFTIDKDGNTGIGSTTPYAKLSVKGAGTTTGVNFQTTNSSDSPLFTILDSGNVGIGATDPTAKFVVRGGSLATAGSGMSFSSNLATGRLTTGQVGSIHTFADNESVEISAGSSQPTGFAIDGQTTTLGSTIRAITGGSERLRITSAGNIGIGTTTPDRKLVISGGSSGLNTGIFAIQNSVSSAANSGASVEFNGVNASSIITSMAKIGTLLQDGTNAAERSDLAFSTKGSGTLAERMRITGAGNVGIGMTVPDAALAVDVGTDNNYIARFKTSDNVSGAFDIFSTSAESVQAWLRGADNVVDVQLASDGVSYFNGGNVGIGTTLPALQSGGTGLHINATASSELKFTNSTSGTLSTDGTALVATGLGFTINNREAGVLSFGTSNTERMTIDASGNVGIGTTGPVAKLHVSDGTVNAAAGLPTAIVTAANTTLISEASIFSVQSTSVQAADMGGSINLGGRGTDAATGAISFAHIAGRKENAISANFAGYLQFGTSDSASDLTERMRITSTGNVGIGTTTPTEKLGIAGNIMLSGGITSYSTGGVPFQALNGGTAPSAIRFQNTGNDAYFGTEGSSAGGFFTGSLSYSTVVYSTAAIQHIIGGSSRMIITTAGNVGIGTTTPSSLMHVAGSTGSTLNYILEPTGWLGLKHRLGVQYSGDTSVLSNNALLTSATAGTLDNTAQTGSALILGSSGTLNYVQASAGSGSRTFTSRLYVDSAGSVGIGTTTPGRLLHVEANTAASIGIRIQNYSTSASAFAVLDFANSVSNTAAQIFLNSSGASSFGGASALNIYQSQNAPIAFSTNAIEYMRITGAGNVGIGTTSPTAKLQVQSGTNLNTQIGNTAGNYTNATQFIDFSSLNNAINLSRANDGAYTESVFNYLSTSGLTNLGLASRGDIRLIAGSSQASVMTLTETGNVGIGIGSGMGTVDYKLDVRGSANNSTSAGIQIRNLAAAGNTLASASLNLKTPTASGGLYALPSDYVDTAVADRIAVVTNSDASGIVLSAQTAGQDIRFFSGGTSESMRISSASNVAIGATSFTGATPKFGVKSTAADWVAQLEANTTTGASYGLRVLGGTNSSDYSMLVGNAGASATHFAIRGDGNIGIGTTNPNTARLQVHGTSGNWSSYLQGHSNTSNSYGLLIDAGTNTSDVALRVRSYSGSEYLYVRGDGNVGIGTSNPQSKLDIEATASTVTVRSTADAQLSLTSTNTWAGMAFYDVNGNDFLWYSGLGDGFSIGGGGSTVNRLSVHGNATVGTGFYGTVAPTNGLLVEGNLGVGTTTAGRPVSIASSAAQGVLGLDSTAGGGTYIGFTNAGASKGSIGWSNQGTTGLAFLDSAGSGVNMLITNAGNVGIGPTAPLSKLHVTATAAASMTLGSPTGVGLTVAPTGGGYGLNMGANSDGKSWIQGGRIDGSATTYDISLQAAGGNVGIGMTNASVALDVTGDIEYTGSITDVSDRRLKENIQDIENPFSVLSAINGKTYNMIGSNRPEVGFLAQDVQAVLPNSAKIVDAERGYLGVSYLDFIPYLVEGVNELNVRTLSIAPAAQNQEAHSLAVSSDASIAGMLTVTGTGTFNDSLTAASILSEGSVSAASFLTSITETLPSEVLSNGSADLYKMASYAITNLQALSERTDLLATRIDDVEARVAALESSSSAADEISGAVGFSVATLKSALQTLGIYLENGVAQFETLVFRQLAVAKDTNGDSSVGSESILAGNTVIEVQNPYVLPTSKIFVTFTGPIQGAWYISNKEAGKFRVTLASGQSADVSFDYFILQTEGQLASPGAAGPTQTQNVPTPSPSNDPLPPVFPGEGAGTTTPVVGSGDTTPPSITLNGPAAREIDQGATWIDQGATASDETDGDLTSAIQTEGTVDTSTPGLYTVTYSVSDAGGNEAHVSRIVTVQANVVPPPAPEPAPEPIVEPPPVVPAE